MSDVAPMPEKLLAACAPPPRWLRSARSHVYLIGVLLAVCLLPPSGFAQEKPAPKPLRKTALQRELEKRQGEDKEREKLTEEVYQLRRRLPIRHVQNIRRYEEAVDREIKILKKADKYFAQRRYRKARGAYRKALRISFNQWVLDRPVTAADLKKKNDRPQARERKFNLATDRTARAYQKLMGLDALIREENLVKRRAAAEKAYHAGKLTLAYRQLGEVLTLARKMGDGAVAEKTMREAAKRREEIIATVSRPLERAAVALDKNDAGAALDALNEFKARFESFTSNRDIRTRHNYLKNVPPVRKERRKRSAERLLKHAAAATAREDYLTACRRLRTLSRRYADTKAGKTAVERLAKMEMDIQIMLHIERQKMENECKLLLARGKMLLRQRRPQEAMQACDTIIVKYPDTAWAVEAAELAKTIEELLERQRQDPGDMTMEYREPLRQGQP